MTKSGIKTTEFWVHNVLQIGSLLAVAGGQINGKLGAIISTVLGVVYIAARAVVKYAAPAQAGETVTPAPDAPAAKAAPAGVGLSAPGTGKTALLLLGLAVGVWGLAGCAQNLYARWAQANDAYDAALVSLHNLRANGAISQRQEARVAAYMPAAEAALRQALADARGGRATAQAQALQSFQAALLKLTPASGTHAPAITQAATGQ